MQELPIIDAIKNNLKIEQIPIHKVRYHEKTKSYSKEETPNILEN
ncbi:hypothetical protein LEP1GSC168_4158 [Leptospira santarosai str. HAI134]|nr:hypothetical protein LEP1GSC168_4158 [Leptospira santarosai str. HAI134]